MTPLDIAGAFMQAEIDEVVHIKFEYEIAELLTKIDPKLYSQFTELGNGRKVNYATLQKSLYGTLQGAHLFWKEQSTFLVDQLGFELNLYDSFVVNNDNTRKVMHYNMAC